MIHFDGGVNPAYLKNSNNSFKYIMTENGPIIFPRTMNHSDFAEYNPVSAGFVRIIVNDGEYKFHCYGDSVTLQLRSKLEDSDYCNLYF